MDRAENRRVIPATPPPALIDSMCMRWRHDFGLDVQGGVLGSGMTENEREHLRARMRQLYEEVAGNGFYRWPQV